jgi:hypothetical protein
MDNVISNIQTSLHEVHGRFESSGLNLTNLTDRVSALELGIDADFSGQLSAKADKSEVAKFTSSSNVVTTYSITQLGEKLNSLQVLSDNLQSSKVDRSRVSVVQDVNGNDVSVLSREGLGNKLTDIDNEIGLRALTSRVASFTIDGVLTNLSVDELGARIVANEYNNELRALKTEVSAHTDDNNITTKYSVESLGAELHRIGIVLGTLDDFTPKTEVSILIENGEIIQTLSRTQLGEELRNIQNSISNFVSNSEVSKNYNAGTTDYTSNAYTLSDFELGAMLQRFDDTHSLKSEVSKRYTLNNDGTLSSTLDSVYTLSNLELGTKLFDIDALLSTKISGDEVSINASDASFTLSQTELGAMLKTLKGKVDQVHPGDLGSSVFALKSSVSENEDNPVYTLSNTALATKLESIDTLLSSHTSQIASKASITDMADRALKELVSLKYLNDDGVNIDDKFTCGIMELGSLLFNMDAATSDVEEDIADLKLQLALMATAGGLTATQFLSSNIATLPAAVSGGANIVKTGLDLAKAVFGSGGGSNSTPTPPTFIKRSEGILRPHDWGSDFNVDGYARPMIEGRENVYYDNSFTSPRDLSSYVLNLIAGVAAVFYRDVSFTSKVRLLGSAGAAEYGPPASTSFAFAPPAGSALVEAGLTWGSSTSRVQHDGTALSGYTGGTQVLSCFGTSRFEGRSENRKVAWLTGSGTASSSTLDAKLAFDGTDGDSPIHIFGEPTTKYGLNLYDATLVMRNSVVNPKIDIDYDSYNLRFASDTPNFGVTDILVLNSDSNSVGIAGNASSQYKLYVHGGAKFSSGIASSNVILSGNNNSAPFMRLSNTTVGAAKECDIMIDDSALKVSYGTSTSTPVTKSTRVAIDSSYVTVHSTGSSSGFEVVGKLGNKPSLRLRHEPNADATKGTVTLGRYLSIKNDLDASRLYTGHTSTDAEVSELIHMNNTTVTVKGNLDVSGDLSIIDTSVTPNTSVNITTGISTALDKVSTLINGGDLSMLRSDGTSVVLRTANIEAIGHPGYDVTNEQGEVTHVTKTGVFLKPDVGQVDNLLDERLASIGIIEGAANETNPRTLMVHTKSEINGIISEGHIAGSVESIVFSDSETLGSRTFPIVEITPTSNPFITNATITNIIVGIKSVSVSGVSSEQGSGYVAGDTITVADSFGTGTNAIFTVVNASTGGVDGGSTSLTITNPGAYTSISGTGMVVVNGVPTYPGVTGITQQSSSGQGTGVTFSVELSVLSVDIFNAGKGYINPPSVEVSGTYVVGNTTSTSGVQSATAVLHTTSNVTVLDSRFSKASTLSVINTATQLNTALSSYPSIADIATTLSDYYDATETDQLLTNYAPIAAAGETYAYLSTTSLEHYKTSAASDLSYQAKETANDIYMKMSDLTAYKNTPGSGFYDKTTSDGKYQLKPAAGESFALTSSIAGLIGNSTSSLTNYYTKSASDGRFQLLAPSGETYAYVSAIPDVSGFITAGTVSTNHYTKSDSDGRFQQLAPTGETYAYVSAIPDVSGFITAGTVSTNHYTKTDTDNLIPDVSNFITASTSSLSNYDTSSTVNNKISNAVSSPSGLTIPSSGKFRVTNSGYMHGPANSLLELYSTHSSGVIRFTIAGSAKMSIRSTGRVGIGTTNPSVPLHVNDYVSPYVGNGSRGYFAYHHGLVHNYSWWGENTSIYATHSIVSGLYFASLSGTISASDERIKKDITDVDDGSSLEVLRLLKPKRYKYKDEVQRGAEPVWGFIAQEVGAILPYATKQRTECLPNIYELANVSNSNVITFSSFDTSSLESNAMVLKVYDVDDKEHLVNIVAVIDGRSVRVDEDLTEWSEDDKIFVYGQQVNDFVFLQKDAIWTVATSALQEVDRQLQIEKARSDELRLRLQALEARIEALE